MPAFHFHELRIVEPSFSSPLTTLIIELDYLRKKKLGGTTHPKIFFQLKDLFHWLESLASARIEGNNTTVADYLETKIEKPRLVLPSHQEIINMEQAMKFIDDNVKTERLNRAFVSELHKMVVDGLPLPPEGEGDRTPGVYRAQTVTIAGSAHTPPDATQVKECMEGLFRFVDEQGEWKYDLLKTANAHHRFVWIHPFTNGNGRTVRLFTYAMLVKQGFQVDVGRILNPTAVFCSDRNEYYRYLSLADTGTDEGILQWCEYVLKGLKEEIEKIDHLLDYDYLREEILFPAIRFSRERQFITGGEEKVLRVAAEKQVVQSADLEQVLSFKYKSDISRVIARLKKKKMLVPIGEGKRKYLLRFDNNYLLRGIIQALDEKGFLPVQN
jgi:Fic family protein